MKTGGKLSAIGWSLLVHAAIAAGLVVTVQFTAPVQAPAPSGEIIQAEAISQAALDAREAAKERARQEALRRQREAAERAAAERRRQEEAARQAELQRQEELRRQREAAERAAAEEARRKAEAERKAREAEERRRAEEEARRKAEAERKRREAETAARREREQQLQQSLEAEAERMAAIRAGKQTAWIGVISDKVMRNWSPPPNLAENFHCEFEVRQIPGGEVVSVSVGKCDNEVLRRSAEAAIWKASPLPPPTDPSLFDQYVNIIFQPED